MALTKEDLQAIGALMDSKLTNALEPINERLGNLEQGQSQLIQGQANLEQRQTTLEQKQSQLIQGQANLEQKQADLEEMLQLIRASQLKVELEQYPRIAAALEGVTGGVQKDKEQDARIAYLEKKTDLHDARLHFAETQIKKAL